MHVQAHTPKTNTHMMEKHFSQNNTHPNDVQHPDIFYYFAFFFAGKKYVKKHFFPKSISPINYSITL